MIDNLSECQKAVKQLNLPFKKEEYDGRYPGGCYVLDEKQTVFFNKNLKGPSSKYANPICDKGKYDKYIIQIFKL